MTMKQLPYTKEKLYLKIDIILKTSLVKIKLFLQRDEFS